MALELLAVGQRLDFTLDRLALELPVRLAQPIAVRIRSLLTDLVVLSDWSPFTPRGRFSPGGRICWKVFARQTVSERHDNGATSASSYLTLSTNKHLVQLQQVKTVCVPIPHPSSSYRMTGAPFRLLFAIIKLTSSVLGDFTAKKHITRA
ncbi:hypothetical protein [Pseudomonas mosselii]|uniref:hypothetical protein n=1 Tax=Pseudomonas mosselii TaxID=78327 RepID=UPI0028834C47|nr:hypothetical protein [Pseudomonas mosselii]